MMRHATVPFLILAIGIGLGLFFLKYEVQDLENELARLDRAIADDRQAIHVLEAEWSHLNDPTRLADLASRHLGWSAMGPEQMAGPGATLKAQKHVTTKGVAAVSQRKVAP